MPYIKLKYTDEMREFIKLVEELKSVDYSQLQLIFNKWPEEVLHHHAQYLYNCYQLDMLEGSVFVPTYIKEVDHDMVACLWAALNERDNIKKEMFFRGSYPVSLFCWMNDETCKEYIHITDVTLNNLTLLEEKHSVYKSDIERPITYVIVVDNENVLERVNEFNPNVPYETALIDYDSDGKIITRSSSAIPANIGD